MLHERAERIAEIESVTDSIPSAGFTEVMSGLEGASSAVPAAPTSGNIGGISSQVSSISVAASENPFANDRRRHLPLFIGFGALALSIIITAIAIGVTRQPTTTIAPSATARAIESVAASIQALPPATTEAPSATATATATVAASTTPTTTARVTTHTNVVHAAPPPANDDCKIPYTIGSTGEKIYKRHCFQ